MEAQTQAPGLVATPSPRTIIRDSAARMPKPTPLRGPFSPQHTMNHRVACRTTVQPSCPQTARRLLWQDLPLDTWGRVVEFAPAESVLALRRVCRALHGTVEAVLPVCRVQLGIPGLRQLHQRTAKPRRRANASIVHVGQDACAVEPQPSANETPTPEPGRVVVVDVHLGALLPLPAGLEQGPEVYLATRFPHIRSLVLRVHGQEHEDRLALWPRLPDTALWPGLDELVVLSPPDCAFARVWVLQRLAPAAPNLRRLVWRPPETLTCGAAAHGHRGAGHGPEDWVAALHGFALDSLQTDFVSLESDRGPFGLRYLQARVADTLAPPTPAPWTAGLVELVVHESGECCLEQLLAAAPLLRRVRVAARRLWWHPWQPVWSPLLEELELAQLGGHSSAFTLQACLPALRTARLTNCAPAQWRPVFAESPALEALHIVETGPVQLGGLGQLSECAPGLRRLSVTTAGRLDLEDLGSFPALEQLTLDALPLPRCVCLDSRAFPALRHLALSTNMADLCQLELDLECLEELRATPAAAAPAASVMTLRDMLDDAPPLVSLRLPQVKHLDLGFLAKGSALVCLYVASVVGCLDLCRLDPYTRLWGALGGLERVVLGAQDWDSPARTHLELLLGRSRAALGARLHIARLRAMAGSLFVASHNLLAHPHVGLGAPLDGVLFAARSLASVDPDIAAAVGALLPLVQGDTGLRAPTPDPAASLAPLLDALAHAFLARAAASPEHILASLALAPALDPSLPLDAPPPHPQHPQALPPEAPPAPQPQPWAGEPAPAQTPQPAAPVRRPRPVLRAQRLMPAPGSAPRHARRPGLPPPQ